MEGVVNVFPVPSKVPPGAENQLTVKEDVADKLTVPVPQRLAFVTTGSAAAVAMIAFTCTRGLGQKVPAST